MAYHGIILISLSLNKPTKETINVLLKEHEERHNRLNNHNVIQLHF